MTWINALQQLDATGVTEFGIHQMDEKAGTPKWRRHKGGAQSRFHSVRAALFSSDKGARAACLGHSSYATQRYAQGTASVVPYVATWLRGQEIAFLVRAGATEPEVTLVQVSAVESLVAEEHALLLTVLAHLFGQGAEQFGVRHVTSSDVRIP
jgi:hypothetical protein